MFFLFATKLVVWYHEDTQLCTKAFGLGMQK